MDYDFTIIFKKLGEDVAKPDLSEDHQNKSSQEDMTKEINEISELRKIVLEITESELNSYTSA